MLSVLIDGSNNILCLVAQWGMQATGPSVLASSPLVFSISITSTQIVLLEASCTHTFMLLHIYIHTSQYHLASPFIQKGPVLTSLQ